MTGLPRTFALHRDRDITRISGTGVVALGVVFPDGTTVIRWLGDQPSTVVWSSIMHARAIHSHGGATQFVWHDNATGRLARIGDAHTKHVDRHGGTTGGCVECGLTWPCPSYVWATTDRDSVACWDPADDEELDR